MATANTLPPPEVPELEAEVSETVPDEALVPAETPIPGQQLTLSPPVARLPVEMDVVIPVRAFRVRDLLNLAAGAVIATQWVNGDDLPLQAGSVQLAWTEFEVVDAQLAVRITRLA
ncbi:MAG TPA: FliM/FliN family flagellar motor C-terminal domain-containing protein [Terracidiphilus sp.]|nr:FliM/FliN family flagellar motor C-terminal domain-containing protein [Terracidiphilus sp.]